MSQIGESIFDILGELLIRGIIHPILKSTGAIVCAPFCYKKYYFHEVYNLRYNVLIGSCFYIIVTAILIWLIYF